MRALAFIFVLLPFAAQADCVGHNLIAALPADQRAALQAEADAAPYAKGNLWHATKGAQDITLIGTFHLDDPRHAATVALLDPALSRATALLVEAGPAEEASLTDYISTHPDRLIISKGPTLPEMLPAAAWQRVTAAMTARHLPTFVAAKLQPWYLTTILSIPACQFDPTSAANGLDKRLMAKATEKGVAIKALEPYDTLFKVFDSFTAADQMDLLNQTLDTLGTQETDTAVTLTDSYFSGDNRLFWAFSRLQVLALPGADPANVNREFALVEDALIIRRNQSWVPVIETAAAAGPVVVAVGALHLSGVKGVLNLLAQDGYIIAPGP